MQIFFVVLTMLQTSNVLIQTLTQIGQGPSGPDWVKILQRQLKMEERLDDIVNTTAKKDTT